MLASAKAMSKLALAIAALTGWRRVLVALAAGLAGAMALPPFGVWPALIVGLTVLVWLIDGARGQQLVMRRRLRTAFIVGWAFGFGYFGVSLYWIGEAFLVDAELFAWLMPLAVTAMPAGLALFWGVAAALAMRLWTPGPSRILVLAAAFGVLEWLRGHVLTGFPWNAPGYALDSLIPLAQLASLVGLYGLNVIVIAWAAAPAAFADPPAAAPRSRRWPVLAVLAAGLAVGLAFGAWRLALTVEDQPGLIVRIVQPNIAQKDKWRPENRRWIYRRFLEMTAASPPAPAGTRRIVVWPESALPVFLAEQPGTLREVATSAGVGSVLITGSLYRGAGAVRGAEVFNSVLVLGENGVVTRRYHKSRLVPFGEYLPLAGLLRPLGIDKLVPLPVGFGRGLGPVSLKVEGIPAFTSLVCYEVIFPNKVIDRADRPAWIVNVTNDAWFGNSAGPHQHLAQARMRAIEEGLPLIRAANTGVSAVIDPLGRTVLSAALGTRMVLDSPLPQPLPVTLFGRYGDAGFALILLLIAICRIRTFFADSD